MITIEQIQEEFGKRHLFEEELKSPDCFKRVKWLVCTFVPLTFEVVWFDDFWDCLGEHHTVYLGTDLTEAVRIFNSIDATTPEQPEKTSKPTGLSLQPPDPEDETLRAFITAATTGEADAEFRALWLIRAQRQRANGVDPTWAEHWAEIGRPPARRKS